MIENVKAFFRSLIPPSKPQISENRIRDLLRKHDVNLQNEGVVLIGVRGYFRDSMGKAGKNDIGCFDDALFWITSSGDFAGFNANTDPSRYYKNVATLKTGKWTYKKGWHGYGKPTGHPAFRQAAPVRVLRWQSDGVFKEFPLGDTINVHRGGNSTTSSAGCQTLPPQQWAAFKELGYLLLDRYKKKTFLYLLVENDGSIA